MADGTDFFVGLENVYNIQSKISGGRMATAIGDSITQVQPWSSLAGTPYTKLGFAGGQVADLVTVLPQVLPGALPTIAIVMIGINDVTTYNATSFASNLNAIISQLKAYTSQIYLCTILPWEQSFTPSSPITVIQTMNTQIKAIASTNAVGVLDTYAAFAGTNGWAVPGYTVDGTHPSAAGFAAIYSLYSSAITNPTVPLTLSWNATNVFQDVLTNQNHDLTNCQGSTGIEVRVTNIGTVAINVTCTGGWGFEVVPGGSKGPATYILQPGCRVTFGNSNIANDGIWRRVQ